MKRGIFGAVVSLGLLSSLNAAGGPDPFAAHPGATITFGYDEFLKSDSIDFVTASKRKIAWLLVGSPDESHPYLDVHVQVENGFRQQGISGALYTAMLKREGLAPVDTIWIEVNRARFSDALRVLDESYPYRLWAAAESTPSFRTFRKFGYFVAGAEARGEARMVFVEDDALRAGLNRGRRWMALATASGNGRVPDSLLGPYASQVSARRFTAPALTGLWEEQSEAIEMGGSPIPFRGVRPSSVPTFQFCRASLGRQDPFTFASAMTDLRSDLYPRTAALRSLIQQSRKLGMPRLSRMLWLRAALR